MSPRRLSIGFAVACALIAALAVMPRGAAEPVLGPAPDPTDGPAGANDWSCRPSAAEPDPVVLVHGAGTDATQSFAQLAPLLQRAGYCAYTANFGRPRLVSGPAAGPDRLDWPGTGPMAAALSGRVVYGVADIAATSAELAEFVGRVRAATGAKQVALVGHSTGGTVIRQFLHGHPGAASTVVTLATPYRGSTYSGLPAHYPDLAALGLDGPQIAAQVYGTAGAEQAVGSPVLARLDAEGETTPGVRWTAIASRADEVITPPESALLAAPKATDRNLWVQDTCPGDPVAHAALLTDPHALDLVVSALADAPPDHC
ncbi:triacylglycerol lipase [Nocardia sp. BMG111209]|uniref:esterase/lipase family protein n=1 Tax=Nocardia sp. BMG111209 TaxID=1160137 RepID=UPI00056C988B|nr:alpha/beta fold hydrolase [Nocardia sp. BMG111209]